MPMEQVEFEFPDEKEAKENARKGGAVVAPEKDRRAGAIGSPGFSHFFHGVKRRTRLLSVEQADPVLKGEVRSFVPLVQQAA